MPENTASRSRRPAFTTGRRASRALAALVVVVLLGTGLLLTACAATLPTQPAGITGTVTSLVPGDDRPASMLVEAPGASGNKAQVTIVPQTLFFDAAGKMGTASGIVVGTKVSVWFSGAVAESYPEQGTAQDVQVLGK